MHRLRCLFALCGDSTARKPLLAHQSPAVQPSDDWTSDVASLSDSASSAEEGRGRGQLLRRRADTSVNASGGGKVAHASGGVGGGGSGGVSTSSTHHGGSSPGEGLREGGRSLDRELELERAVEGGGCASATPSKYDKGRV